MVGGDMSAFAQLYERYRGLTVRCAERKFSSHDLALDVSQETFLQLLRRPPQSLKDGTLAGWLARVTINKAIDRLRQLNRGEVSLEHLGEALPDNKTPLSELLAGEDDAILEQRVAQLPEEFQKLIRMRFYRNYTFSQIAEECNIPLGTALWRLNHAIHLLQAMYHKNNN
jgi:RNA polymerase sigma factor (sigma-70 family)